MRVHRWWEPNPPPEPSARERVAGPPTGTTNRPAPFSIPRLWRWCLCRTLLYPLAVGTPPSSCAGGGGLSVLPISYPYQIALRLAPRRASFEQDVCCTHGEELSLIKFLFKLV